MKKFLLMMALISGFAISVDAQLFADGNKYLHFGLGLGNPYSYRGSDMLIPPVHVSYEQAITDNIGLGGIVGFSANRYDYNYGGWGHGYHSQYTFTYILVGFRGAYHFNVSDKFDLYAGAMAGFNIASTKYVSDYAGPIAYAEPKTGGPVAGAFGGVRYNLNEKIAIFSEIGYSVSFISAGLCVNL